MKAGRFVVVGDSFGEGIGDPHLHFPNGVRGWADRMARQLGRNEPAWQYANLAMRSKLLGEVVAQQLDVALALRPTLVALNGGGNDLLSLRTDVAAVAEQLDDAAGRARAAGADLLMFGIATPRTSAVLDRLRARVHTYNGLVHEVARARGAAFINPALHPEFADPRLWAPDRIHLSRPGHKRTAALVLAELGVPHTLRIKDIHPRPDRTWPAAARDEVRFVRTEVLPLVRRRLTGVNQGQTLPPKWPVWVHPAAGLKRLATTHSGAALRAATRSATG